MRKNKSKIPTIDKDSLLLLSDRLSEGQLVFKDGLCGTVVGKFLTIGGLPQVWVVWEGSDFPISEMPDKLIPLETDQSSRGNSHEVEVSSRGNNEPCLGNSICAVGLELDSLSLGLGLKDFNSSDSVRGMNIVGTSSTSDIQEHQSTGTLGKNNGGEVARAQTLLPQVHLANPSQSKEKDLEPKTLEIASPISSELSRSLNLDSFALKMSEDFSVVDFNQKLTKDTLDFYSTNFPPAGTMSNGKLSHQPILERPGVESEYLLLESPGALSSSEGTSRPPGSSKLENQLRSRGAINGREVANPEFLENSFDLPCGWTDPQEKKSALEFLQEMGLYDSGEQPSEIPLIGESQRSPSDESSTLTLSPTINPLEPEVSEVESSKGFNINCPACQQVINFINNQGNCKCFKWFLTIPYYDQLAWGEEPLDPDDIWHVGEHVQWKKERKKGVVRDLEQREILGAKLNYVVVQWDDSSSEVLIEPEELLRLDDRREAKPRIIPLEQIKVDDFVQFGDESVAVISIKDQEAELWLDDSYSIWRDLSSLRLATKVVDKYGTWWQISGQASHSIIIPIWYNPRMEVINKCDEKYIVLEKKRNQILVIREGLRPKNNLDSEGWTIGSADPFWINNPVDQEKKRRGARGKQHQTGTLYPYLKNKKLKDGRIASYPRVEGKRDPDNIKHWYWAYSYEECIDGEWRNRSLSVPSFRVRTVREMVKMDMSMEAIKALIKGEFSL